MTITRRYALKISAAACLSPTLLTAAGASNDGWIGGPLVWTIAQKQVDDWPVPEVIAGKPFVRRQSDLNVEIEISND